MEHVLMFGGFGILVAIVWAFTAWDEKDRQKRLDALKANRQNERQFANLTGALSGHIARVEAQVKENDDPIHILFEIENAELRQTMIKKYGGFEVLLAKTKHDILHTDDFGVLFRVWVAALNKHFYYVKVINGTMEDDGSRREYYKEVPPDMDTAKEAVAWTYGLHPDDYHIAIRT